MQFYEKNNKGNYELTPGCEKLEYVVTTTFPVTAEVIENTIVDAIELQSTYWCGVNNTTHEWKDKPENMCISQYIVEVIMSGGSIELYDIEDPEETWELSLEYLLQGMGIAVSQGYEIEDCADEVLQFALFGELVYG